MGIILPEAGAFGGYSRATREKGKGRKLSARGLFLVTQDPF
jgi:hypothetical protein